MKKQKKEEKVQIKGFVFNIKIASNNREGEEIILSLFRKIHRDKIRKPVTSDREMAIRTMFTTKLSTQDIGYGKLVSAIDLTESQWLNLDKMEGEKYPIPKNLRARMKENAFYLVPKAHRLFIERNSNENISNGQIAKFLMTAIKEVLKDDEDVEIIIEKDSEAIAQIIEASTIEWLDIKLSRSNNDTNEDAAEWLEGQLDDMQANIFNAKIVADNKKDGLNKENKIIKGALDLVSSNGTAKAKIVTVEGESQTLSTNEYEKRFNLATKNEDTKIPDIVRMVMRLFRNG